MAALTDEELVARCKAELPSDTRSYEMLVQRHMNRVYSLVYRVVANKEEAEDIAQEVFIKVYHGLHKFEQQASFSSWLYRIATNCALDALDKIKRRPKAAVPVNDFKAPKNEEEIDPLHLQPSQAAGPEDSLILAELRECICRVLKKLEREQARLLIMRDFDDLSYDEIANVLQVGMSTVKMRIHRARLAFQEFFNQFCGRVYLNFPVSSSGKAEMKKE
ncbi:MAG: sigma-70 family RNA polymerase sigma factor [Chloroflexi bacterium]|nr:MAG: sigma-70 family RNA polymerase sigma factor [Chloroflexota bacterium]